ncbi:putative membrane protein YfcA [Arthrobacter sp. TE12231]
MRAHVRWADGAWSLLVLFAVAVTACGLAESFSLIVRSPTDAEGHGLVFLGSTAFAAAAVWARLRRRPLWVSILTALPAVVVGGLSAENPDGLYAHLAGLFLVPAALSAMLADLLFPDPQILPAWDAEADPAN